MKKFLLECISALGQTCRGGGKFQGWSQQAEPVRFGRHAPKTRPWKAVAVRRGDGGARTEKPEQADRTGGSAPARSPPPRVRRAAAENEEIPTIVQFSAEPERSQWQEFLSWSQQVSSIFPECLDPKPNCNPAERLRFGEEEQRNECALSFEKSRSKRYAACSDVVEEGGFEPPKPKQQIYSLPHLTALEFPQILYKLVELVDGLEPPAC